MNTQYLFKGSSIKVNKMYHILSHQLTFIITLVITEIKYILATNQWIDEH